MRLRIFYPLLPIYHHLGSIANLLFSAYVTTINAVQSGNPGNSSLYIKRTSRIATPAYASYSIYSHRIIDATIIKNSMLRNSPCKVSTTPLDLTCPLLPRTAVTPYQAIPGSRLLNKNKHYTYCCLYHK